AMISRTLSVALPITCPPSIMLVVGDCSVMMRSCNGAGAARARAHTTASMAAAPAHFFVIALPFATPRLVPRKAYQQSQEICNDPCATEILASARHGARRLAPPAPRQHAQQPQ